MTKPDKILAHELLDREVLNLKAGEVAGSVVDFGINRDGKVELIGILPVSWYAGGRGVAPSSITFLTNDRLCIASGDALQDFGPDGDALISTNSGGQIYGKMVLLHDGEQLGELVDFRFSLDDGKISDLLVLDAEDKRVRIPIAGISTIGKDYIIIERARPEGETAGGGDATGAATGGGDAAGAASASGDESPFSEAAAAAPAPAAAKQRSPAVKRSPAPSATPPKRPARGGKAGKATKEIAPEEPEVVAEAAPPPSANGIPAEIEAPVDTTPMAAAEPQPEPAPSAPAPDSGLQTRAFAETSAGAAVAAAADESSLFTSGGQPISKFDQKKLDFLRGKRVPRDIKDAEGAVLVAKDDTLDQTALQRIVEAGMLGEVFIEMTLRK
jgi:sporulation protein YlmC with PRC-barrel domain